MRLPKLSTPLAKSLRTAEGILVAIVNALVALTAGIDPHTLPRKEAAIILAAQNGALLAQRGLIKIVALQKGLGVGAPIDDQKLEHTMQAIVDQAAQIDQLIPQLTKLAEQVAHPQVALPGSVGTVARVGGGLETALATPTQSAANTASSPPQSPLASDEDPALDVAVGLSDDDEQAIQPPSGADPATITHGLAPEAPPASAPTAPVTTP
jgi:hypothetical protein